MTPRPAYLRPDAVAAVVLLVFAVALWLGAGALPQSRLGGGVGADGLPKLLAFLLAILSVILLVQALIAKPGASDVVPDDETPRSHFRATGILGIGVLVLLALPVLGYAPTMALLLVAMAWFHGRRVTARLVIFCAIGGVAFYLLFVELLSVRMPVGVWPRLLPF